MLLLRIEITTVLFPEVVSRTIFCRLFWKKPVENIKDCIYFFPNVCCFFVYKIDTFSACLTFTFKLDIYILGTNENCRTWKRKG